MTEAENQCLNEIALHLLHIEQVPLWHTQSARIAVTTADPAKDIVLGGSDNASV